MSTDRIDRVIEKIYRYDRESVVEITPEEHCEIVKFVNEYELLRFPKKRTMLLIDTDYEFFGRRIRVMRGEL